MLTDAERRVLTDLAMDRLPLDEQRSYRFVSTFRDFASTREPLVKRGLIEVTDTIPRITDAGRAALEVA